MGVIGLFAAIILLIILAYRGISGFAAAIICSVIVAITNGMPVWDSMINFFMGGFNGFVGAYLFVFASSTLFAKAVDESGTARSIAYAFLNLFGKERVVLAIIIAAAALTYGGVSLFVVIFALYPICIVLMKEGNIPKRLLPGILCVGAGTFSMTALPGTPQLANVVPAEFLGTPLTAGTVMGLFATAFMLIASLLYFNREVRIAAANGEGFVPGANDDLSKFAAIDEAKLPGKLISFIPLVFILAGIIGGSMMPVMKGRTTMLVVLVMLIATILVYILNYKTLKGKEKAIINQGLSNAIPSIAMVSVIIGFGTVAQNSPAFQSFIQLIFGMKSNPYISAAIAGNLISGITGSSSGGLQIFLKAMGEQYLAMGVNPAILHRMLAIAAGSLDKLPHCGGIFILLGAMGLTHKESYKQIFIGSVVIPFIASVLCVIMAVMLY